jgi:hypothetical protein
MYELFFPKIVENWEVIADENSVVGWKRVGEQLLLESGEHM